MTIGAFLEMETAPTALRPIRACGRGKTAMNRISLADAHEDEVVEDACGRQRDVHDLDRPEVISYPYKILAKLPGATRLRNTSV